MRCLPASVRGLGALAAGLLLAGAIGCHSSTAGSGPSTGGGGGAGGGAGAGVDGASEAPSDAARDLGGGGSGGQGGGGSGGGGQGGGGSGGGGQGGGGTGGGGTGGLDGGGTGQGGTAGSIDAPTAGDTGASLDLAGGGDTPAPVDAGSDAGAAPDTRVGHDGPARTCSATPGGCLCFSGPTQGVCDKDSVVSGPDEAAICCAGSILCSCQAFACKFDSTQQLCTCGNKSLVDGTASGVRVATCPAGGANQHCCRSAAQSQCVCLPGACSAGEVEVPNCSPSTPAACMNGDVSVDFCQ